MGRNKKHSDEFKREVANSVLSGTKRAIEAARDYGVHPSQVHKWVKDLTQGNDPARFSESDRERQRLEAELNRYKQKVGEQAVEIDLLKKFLKEREHKRRLKELSSSVVTGANLDQFKKPAKR